jgi:hypothetical protein
LRIGIGEEVGDQRREVCAAPVSREPKRREERPITGEFLGKTCIRKSR